MVHTRATLYILLSACLVSGGEIHASEPPLDAVLEPGQSFQGRFAFEGDQDRVELPLLAGSRVWIRAAAISSRVHPRLKLYRNGIPVRLRSSQVITRRRGRMQLLKGVSIEQEATYELRLSNRSQALGAYRMILKERLPRKLGRRFRLGNAQTGRLGFPARTDATATILLRTRGRGSGPLLLPVLRAPGGKALSLTDLVVSFDEGRRLEIGPVPLPADGGYLLEVTGNRRQVIKARVSLNHVRPEGDRVEEAEGRVSVSGSVMLGDGFWLPSGGAESGASADEEGDVVARQLLVRVLPGADPRTVALELDCELLVTAPDGWSLLATPGAVEENLASPEERAELEALATRASRLEAVVWAQPNYLRTPYGVPDDPLYGQQWALLRAGFEDAWQLEPGDGSGSLALVDTGVRFGHPDLAGRLLAGFDFVSDPWNAGDGDGIDGDPTDPFAIQGTHGTHVAGIMAATTNNGTGVVGATMAGQVLPIRVLGAVGGTDFDLAQGLRYAAGLANVSGSLPARPVEVINLSLGGPADSPLLRDAVRAVAEASVLLVAAAGNGATTQPMYPAAYPQVIAVAATDAVDDRAYYSSFGNHLDLAAPGGDSTADRDGDGWPDGILSTVVDGAVGSTYARKAGTSMAAPHVSAAAFLLLSQDGGLSPLEVRAYLLAGAIDRGPPGWDPEFGYGRLDAGQSLRLAAGQGPGPARPFSSPRRLLFTTQQQELSFATVNQGGTGPIQVLSVTGADPWLSPVTTVGQTPCTLAARGDPTGMLPGSHYSRLVLQTTAGELSLPVELEVGDGAPVGVREVFVLAFEVGRGLPLRIESVSEETADLFLLDPLPEGTYRIVGTTDLDGDGIAGEDHDFSGEVMNPHTGGTELILRDGSALNDLPLILYADRSGDLPGGGHFVVGG